MSTDLDLEIHAFEQEHPSDPLQGPQRTITANVPATLHLACSASNRSAVQYHLALGADVSEVSAEGWRPLHISAGSGQERIVRLLLGAGAKPDARSVHLGACSGATALHVAAAGRHEEVVRLLLRAGADPSARDDAGFTALHIAAIQGDLPTVRHLLKAGADGTAIVGEYDAVDLARGQRHGGVAALLSQCAGRPIRR